MSAAVLSCVLAPCITYHLTYPMRVRGDSVAAPRVRGSAVCLLAVVTALLFLTPVSRAESGTPAAREARAPRIGSHLVSGDVDLLTVPDREALQGQLETASQALGSPVAILLVDRLSHTTAAAVAQDTFETRQMAELARDPILLVVAVHDQQAAIETGKGPFGVVPEIDARGIVARLTHHLSRANLAARLALAGREIVASAAATHARRQPLAADEPVGSPATVDSASNAAATTAPAPPGANGPTEGEDPPASEPVPAGKPRSRLPFAIAAGVLFLLSLALYKRHQMSTTRKPPSADSPPPPSPRIGDGGRRPPG